MWNEDFIYIYLYHLALRPGTAQYCKSNKLKGGQKQQNSKNKEENKRKNTEKTNTKNKQWNWLAKMGTEG